MTTLESQLKQALAFDEPGISKFVTDTILEAGGEHVGVLRLFIVAAAKLEHARTSALVERLIAVAVAAEEHVETVPDVIGNECVALGGADGLRETLAALRAEIKERGE